MMETETSATQHFSENGIGNLYQKADNSGWAGEEGKSEKQQRGHQGQRRRRKGVGEEVLQELKHISTAL